MIQKLSPSFSQIVTILVLMSFILISCAPAPFKPYKPPEIHYDKLEPYDIQDTLAMIPKPEKLQPIYVRMLDGDRIEQLPADRKGESTHVLLVPKEYAKVGGVVKLAKTYKEITIEQEILVNTYIDQINALREMLELERQKALLYRELWVDSENAYRQELADHKRDNMINRTGMYLITIGSIIAIALAL
jgi:hypothetical protein